MLAGGDGMAEREKINTELGREKSPGNKCVLCI